MYKPGRIPPAAEEATADTEPESQSAAVDGVLPHDDGRVADEHVLPIEDSPAVRHRNEGWRRGIVGAGMLAVGAAAAVAFASGVGEDDRAEYHVPFSPAAQEAVISIDDHLAEAGKWAFPGSLFVIGAVKLGATRSPRLRAADRDSSQEPSSDGSPGNAPHRRVLRAVAAGSMPVVAISAVGLATFTEAISTEVGQGPNRPIERLFEYMGPGTLVAGYEGAMPMVQSNVTRELEIAVRTEAQERGIGTTAIGQNLGQLVHGDQTLSKLTLGIEQADGSRLDWKAEAGCDEPVPVTVDEAADIPVGSTVQLNGTEAVVVEHATGMSAMNRIGVVMDLEAVDACLAKDADAPHHIIGMQTDEATAESILAEANTGGETAAVITTGQYIENNEKFWKSNVKPITNVLALVSGGVALLSMSGMMSARLLRNRRELAAKMAAGVSDTYIRATELLRATKDGVVASTFGTMAAAAGTPMANALESGFHASVGAKEVFVGFAVGTIGSIGGAFARLIKLRKTVNPQENTRT